MTRKYLQKGIEAKIKNGPKPDPDNHKAPQPIDKQIGALVKKLREDANLSQSYLADWIGITFQQVQKYEKGSNRISIGRLILICKAVGITPQTFFDMLHGKKTEATDLIDTQRKVALARGKKLDKLREVMVEFCP